jgi:hypothetical protein
MPARITEPPVGASTCASGSQVWTGNIGTLIAKVRAKAANSQTCWCTGKSSRSMSSYAKLQTPPLSRWKVQAIQRMPTSISRLPAMVKRKNLTAA